MKYKNDIEHHHSYLRYKDIDKRGFDIINNGENIESHNKNRLTNNARAVKTEWDHLNEFAKGKF